MIASDLVLFGPANRPEDETSTAAGSIDAAARPIDTPLSSNQNLEIVSDGTDTRTLTVKFRNAGGSEVTEAVVLTSGTPVAVPNGPAERVLSVTASATDGTRTATLRIASAGATVHDINPNEDTGYRLFRKSQSSGAGAETFYEPVYWKNTHSTDNLLAGQSQLSSDPDAKYKVGIAAAKGNIGTTTNRKTAPGGITFVDDAVDQAVPGTDLDAGETIAVWIEASIPQSEPAFKSSPQVQMAGTSSA